MEGEAVELRPEHSRVVDPVREVGGSHWSAVGRLHDQVERPGATGSLEVVSQLSCDPAEDGDGAGGRVRLALPLDEVTVDLIACGPDSEGATVEVDVAGPQTEHLALPQAKSSEEHGDSVVEGMAATRRSISSACASGLSFRRGSGRRTPRHGVRSRRSDSTAQANTARRPVGAEHRREVDPDDRGVAGVCRRSFARVAGQTLLRQIGERDSQKARVSPHAAGRVGLDVGQKDLGVGLGVGSLGALHADRVAIASLSAATSRRASD